MKRNKNLKHPTFRVIYFLQYRADLPIKIGWTKSWSSRYDAFNTFSPYGVRVVKVVSGSQGLEKKMHNLFAKYNTHGEWFTPTEELYEFIKQCPVDDVFALEKLVNSYKVKRVPKVPVVSVEIP